jgi:hypothetical protein
MPCLFICTHNHAAVLSKLHCLLVSETKKVSLDMSLIYFFLSFFAHKVRGLFHGSNNNKVVSDNRIRKHQEKRRVHGS